VTEEWLPVSSAPSDADLEVCIIDFDGILHALEFPCHKDKAGWFDAMTKKRLDIQPTHWRRWTTRPLSRNIFYVLNFTEAIRTHSTFSKRL
jgi:hypothetical protein